MRARRPGPRRGAALPLTPALPLALALLTVTAMTGLAAGARAADEEERPGPRPRGFEPVLSLGFGVQGQDLRGTQSTDFAELSGGRQANLRFAFAEAEALLLGPTLTERLGLRLFLRAGGQLPFTDEHLASNAAAEFNKAPQFPLEDFDDNCAPLPTPVPPNDTPVYTAAYCALSGRNKVIVNGSLFAGLGIDLTLPLGSFQFHLRPSLNYYVQSLHGEGITTRLTTAAETINCTAGQPSKNGQVCHDPIRPGVERYELLFNQAEQVRGSTGDRWLHGFGPRLELDIEVAKVGDAVVEFFVQSGIYWLLSDREIEFIGTGVTGPGTCRQTSPTDLTIPEPDLCSPLRPGGEPLQASYKSEAGPVIVQGGAGFRVLWRGFGL